MTKLKINSKINEDHLKRKAVVYLRQSSERQVRHNKESQRLQYGLKDKAKELGWREIEVIDSDLGVSAAVGSPRRVGFERLLASVAIGEVGIILSREASRLSRTDKDWCRLLEVCSLFDTLIGDEEQIYNPNNMDDQLVLGIKGTLSVVELKILRMRLIAGMEAKAKRGEMKRLTPPGYIWNAVGKVVKDPDKRIQGAIKLVFKKFMGIQTIRGTFLWFHNENIELPVNKFRGGKRIIKWQLPTKSFVKDVLRNPFYAGAYVWGRRENKMEYTNGRVVKRLGRELDPEEAKVFIKGHHEGYIDWQRYEENREIIRRNNLSVGSDEAAGAVREGQGLLAGVLRCRRCGRKLQIRYWGKKGTAPRYLCKGDFEYGGKYCIAFGGKTVDKKFSNELLKVISSYSKEASIKALEIHLSKENEKIKTIEKKIKQLEYEEMRAHEQYNEVDPRNRLVAAELEKQWNEKLEELEKARRELIEISNEKSILTKNDQEQIRKLGEEFADIWESEYCSSSIKKKIIRTVVEEIIVDLDEEEQMLNFIIHWKGGCHTEFEMPKPVSAAKQTTKLADIEIIQKMAVRYGDDVIALVLNQLRHRTGKGNRWNEQRVKGTRVRNSIKGQRRTKPNSEILTLKQAAKYCEVSETTIKKLVKSGILEKNQIICWAPWEIKKLDLDSEQIQNIIKRLHRTGKLILKGESLKDQLSLL